MEYDYQLFKNNEMRVNFIHLGLLSLMLVGGIIMLLLTKSVFQIDTLPTSNILYLAILGIGVLIFPALLIKKDPYF